MLKKIIFTIFLSLSGLSLSLSADEIAHAGDHELVVFKSPTCGCCNSWISHMEASGFAVESINKNDMDAVKKRYGIDGRLQSCHTAVDKTTGLVFEGHVPAGAVKEFLARTPEGAKGLSVPGMPAGSPGMEMGDRFNPYQIVQLNKDLPPSLYMNVKTQKEQYVIGDADE